MQGRQDAQGHDAMPIDPSTLRSGVTLLIGAPSDPQLTEGARVALSAAVAGIPGILEAHVPQIATAGSGDPPRQVLVLVIAEDARPDQVMQALGPKLHEVVPAGVYLDVLPLTPRHQLLPVVRKTGCQIFGAPATGRRQWWRFWA